MIHILNDEDVIMRTAGVGNWKGQASPMPELVVAVAVLVQQLELVVATIRDAAPMSMDKSIQ